MKIFSWNVNGIRACIKKGFYDFLETESPDVLCLQEVKAFQEQVNLDKFAELGYHISWNAAEKPGYSGVATFSKTAPLNWESGIGISEFDKEGRVIRTSFKDFDLYNIYFPNGQKDDERLDFKLRFYDSLLEILKVKLKKGEKIIVCGDYNTAHHPIDLARPKENENYSGFLPVERSWMDKLVDAGFIDSFRFFNKDSGYYSWWSYRMRARERNVGWRIDYHFISSNLKDNLKSADIETDVSGSDHCPVSIELQGV